MTGQMSKEEITCAIEDVKILKSRYFQYSDMNRRDIFFNLFTDDATVLFHDVIDDFMPAREFFVTLGQVTQKTRRVHKGFMPDIQILSPDRATGVWSMEDRLYWTDTDTPDGITQMVGQGHYSETYARVDGEWKIRTLELTRLRLELQISPPHLKNLKTFQVFGRTA